MESMNYELAQVELATSDAKEIITELVNAQIKLYRIKSMQAWERNHNQKNIWQGEIEKLLEIKSNIHSDFDQFQNNSNLLKVNFSLELENLLQQEKEELSESMMY